MNSEELAIIAAIIRNQRVAALGTLRDELPFTSMVAMRPSRILAAYCYT